MTNKKSLIIFMIIATMLCADASAQGFLKKLKDKGEKKLKQATEQVVKGAVDDAVESTTGIKGVTKKSQKVNKGSQKSRSNGRATASSSSRKKDFNPGTKRVTIRLCDGIGAKPAPLMGTNTSASQLPPNVDNIKKLNAWLAAQTRCYEYTNARVVEEEAKISKVLTSDEAYSRHGEAENVINKRAEAVERVVNNLLSMLRERNTAYDSPEDSSEDYYQNLMLLHMNSTEYKVAMRSSIEPLYPYMASEVVAFLKSINLKTYTVDATVYLGGTNLTTEVRSGDFWYVVNPDKLTASLTAYDPQSTPAASVAVPATIQFANRTFNVTEIGVNAFFRYKTITSISLPESIKKIDSGAFVETSITALSLPNSITEFGQGALSGIPLIKSITIPNSVKKIPHSLVAECKSLTTVIFPNAVDEMGKGVCEGCPALTSVTLPQNITTITESTFENCTSLARLDVPSSVTTYDQLCFYGCKGLKTLPMGENVTEIGWRSFAKCTGLTSIVVPARVKIGFLAFEYCTSLRAATIGSQYKTDPMLTQELNAIFSHCPVMPLKPGLHTGNVKFHDK